MSHILERSDFYDPNNHRPISLTPVISKVFKTNNFYDMLKAWV